MATTAHLWAIGYDDVEQAFRAREELETLAWDSGRAGKYLILDDIAIVVWHPDG
jgi:hypothetical protein